MIWIMLIQSKSIRSCGHSLSHLSQQFVILLQESIDARRLRLTLVEVLLHNSYDIAALEEVLVA